jgi:hypothetical protein
MRLELSMKFILAGFFLTGLLAFLCHDYQIIQGVYLCDSDEGGHRWTTEDCIPSHFFQIIQLALLCHLLQGNCLCGQIQLWI